MEQRNVIITRRNESMKELECLTCEYADERGYITLFCKHPDMPKKQTNKSLIFVKGYPKHCPIANIINKEILQGRKENGFV